jgi:membrane-bound ClpP family serine protease
LVIESPGGRALAAERIIRACRQYANGRFEVAVPNQAKSAATMVCLGSERIWLGPTSELGPINPQQLFTGPDQRSSIVAVENIIKSYEDLMRRAESSTGNVEPYLLQLARYDAREIEELRSASELAEDIAVKALKTSMMARLSETTIKEKVRPLTQTSETKSHGRPIYYEEAKSMGLHVRLMRKNSRKWKAIRRLYTRLDWQVTHKVAKIIEANGLTYSQPIPR